MAYVVITADRGLCGGYNVQVQRAAEGEIKADVLAGRDYTIIAVGRKSEGYFRFRGYTIDRSLTGFTEAPSYAAGRARSAGTSSACTSRARSTASSSSTPGSSPPARRRSCCVRWCRSIATTVAGGDGKAPDAQGVPADYEFEPDAGTILETLLPRYVEARIYAALLNAAASEHAFRQRAMKAATDNAEELIKNLSLIMNRARQDSITTEIMEIVSGAEALSGDDKVLRVIELSSFDGSFASDFTATPSEAVL